MSHSNCDMPSKKNLPRMAKEKALVLLKDYYTKINLYEEQMAKKKQMRKPTCISQCVVKIVSNLFGFTSLF